MWALPLAALLVVGFLGLRALAHAGVDVVVTFGTAADAKAGDTQVVYKGLVVGRVTKVALSPDRHHVDMTLRLDPSVKTLLRTGTKFWLTGAKPSLTDLSSLKAAVAGVTVGMEPGSGEPTRHFMGLEQAPWVLPGTKGATYVLTSDQVGAARPGANVFYHGFEAGKVTGLELQGPQAFRTTVFLQAPYDDFVRPGSLFYNTSAVQVSLSGAGLSTQFAPGNSALGGGVEFDTMPETLSQPHSRPGDAFVLYADRGHALAAPRGAQVPYDVLFEDAVGELEVGAPVRLRGFLIGTVTARSLHFDPRSGRLSTPVTVAIEPERLGTNSTPASSGANLRTSTDALMARLIRLGYRARLAQTPPLVGGRVIDLVRVAGAASSGLLNARSAEGSFNLGIPTTASGDVGSLMGKADDILSKVQQIPVREISADVRRITKRLDGLLGSPEINDSLHHLDSTLAQVDHTVAEVRPKMGPLIDKLNRAADQVQAVATSANAVVSGDGATQDASLPGALREVTDAARTLRSLADYLSRHPEAVIRGKAKAK